VRPVNINAGEAGVVGPSPGKRVNAVRLYLGYGSISYRESSGSRVYHSMQVSFNRRLSGKLTLGVPYTWGKCNGPRNFQEAGDLTCPHPWRKQT
jgi:hypothetical protein